MYAVTTEAGQPKSSNTKLIFHIKSVKIQGSVSILYPQKK